jgi:hypothetical protein
VTGATGAGVLGRLVPCPLTPRNLRPGVVVWALAAERLERLMMTLIRIVINL